MDQQQWKAGSTFNDMNGNILKTEFDAFAN